MDSKTNKKADLFSPESEHSVIASFLVSENQPFEIFDVVSADDFYDPHCRGWFQSIISLFEQNSAIGVDTICSHLAQKGNLNGDEHMLMELSGRYVSDPAYHAKVVKNFSQIRRYRSLAGRVIIEAEKLTDSFEIADIIQSELLKISGDHFSRHKSLIQSIDSVIEATEKKAKGELTYVQTGISSLDVIIDGLRPGHLVVIAARPSVGKTALALSFARNMAKAKVPVDYYSIEQDQDEMTARLICMEGGFSMPELHHRNPMIVPEIYEAAKRSVELEPFLNIDSRSFSGMAALRSRIRHSMMMRGTKVIFIDYLGLMDAPQNLQTKDLQVGYLTRNLKLIAKDYGITVMLLSQLNRNVEGRVEQKPVLSDLRDSGNIEQDADIVLFISRDKKADNGTAEIHVAKNRNGRLWDVPVAFRSNCMHFADLAQ